MEVLGELLKACLCSSSTKAAATKLSFPAFPKQHCVEDKAQAASHHRPLLGGPCATVSMASASRMHLYSFMQEADGINAKKFAIWLMQLIFLR